MNKVLIITALFFLLALPAFSQNAEEALDRIRDWYEKVNASVDQYRKVAYPDVNVYRSKGAEHYSMEGNKIYRLAVVDMAKFFDEDQLVKIVLRFNGDREDLTSEYYFREGNLFFVDKTKIFYHQPKWSNAFQESEKSVARNRFYIQNNQLIKWVDSDINTVGKADPYYDQQEEMILHDSKLYVSIN